VIQSNSSKNIQKGKISINNDVSTTETSLPIITITGKANKMSNGDIKQIIGIIAKDLMPRLSQFLLIDVKIVRGLAKKEDILGDATWSDPDSRYPRDFEIRLDSSMSRLDMVETIAHEMTHIKQYAKGELKDYFRCLNRTRWKGKVYESLKYEERPWELEAQQNEKVYNEKLSYLINKGKNEKITSGRIIQ
jgi:hypothetical protein